MNDSMPSSKEYEVLRVKDRPNFKLVHLKCLADETQHTVTVFNDYPDYDKVQKGNTVEGWIRENNSYYNLVAYCKPQRNWKERERFY